MGPIDHISLLFRRMKQRKMEYMIIIITLALGTAVICLAFALNIGINKETAAVIKQSNELYIEITANNLTLNLLYEIKDNISEIKYIYVDGVQKQLLLERSRMKKLENSLPVIYTTADYFGASRQQLPGAVRDKYLLKKGRFFTEEDVEDANRVLVLGSEAAEKIFPKEDPLGKIVTGVHSGPYTIIGILQEIPSVREAKLFNHNINIVNQSAVAPVTTNFGYGSNMAENKTGFLKTEILGFKIIPENITRIDRLYNKLEAYLKQNYGDEYNLSIPYGINGELRKEVKKYKMIGYFAVSVGIIIAIINVLNLLMARMLRGKKDFAIFTEMGLRKSDIFAIFIYETLLLSLTGGILGYFTAVGGKNIFTTVIPGFLINVNGGIFAAAVGASFLVTLIFGIYPIVTLFRTYLSQK